MTTSDQVLAALHAAALHERSEILALIRAELQRAERQHHYETAAVLRIIIKVIEARPDKPAGMV